MKLSICIVSYNVCQDLKECLQSVRDALCDIDHEVIVADNASKDDTKEMVRKNFPEAVFIEGKENLGFAKANNVAYKRSSGDVLLFLNPDTVIQKKGFKEALENFRNAADTGAMGPKLLNADGTYQRGSIRKFPRPLDTIVRLTFLRKVPLVRRIARGYRMNDFNADAFSYVEQISGAAFFVKRDVFEKAGLFDEGFFIFYEEVDLCRRIWDMGYKIAYDPAMNIVHTGGQSRKKEDGSIRCINIRSLLYYFRKHLKGLSRAAFLLFFKGFFLLDLLLESFVDGLMSVLPHSSNKKSTGRTLKKDFRKLFVKKYLGEFIFKW